MTRQLFLLEDDVLLHSLIKDFLEQAGYGVVGAYDTPSALEILAQKSFDLLVLDVQLPGSANFEVLQVVRELKIQTPVVVISVFSDIVSLRKAFSIGASDYLKKPFDLEELQVRIERLLVAQKIVINTHAYYDNGVLCVEGERFFLTSRERQLLEFFLQHPRQVLSSEQIIANVWAYESGLDDSTLRTYIKNLRKILGKQSIQNIKGLGYSFCP
ncbi:copper response regulator transcription factor CrdR [Helicobacter baculiformis]|uniref:Copper response regulator transcription factor CrdR n=1 Tax=Helicobacter baculiformis TaxID=427351 RepID=A0ABV7ZLA1_9HELI|nr:copper response regulator transcription factor CrdR [Helicobacter baculiformis]